MNHSVQNMYHWFRTLNKIIFTVYALILGSVLLSCLSYLIYSLYSKNTKWIPAIFKRIEDSEGPEPPYSDSTFALIFFIVTTELIIRWNHIKDVNNITGTGQIIPIVVA